ncbi:MAG: hypothetical protein AAF483_14720 [Planctomycetota bacterium]
MNKRGLSAFVEEVEQAEVSRRSASTLQEVAEELGTRLGGALSGGPAA